MAGGNRKKNNLFFFFYIFNGFLLSSLPRDPLDAHIKMPPKCQQGNGGIHQDAVFPSRAAGRRRRARLSSRAPSLSVPPANASAFYPPYLLHQTPACILNPELDLVPFPLYQFANLIFLGCHFKQCGLTPDTDGPRRRRRQSVY